MSLSNVWRTRIETILPKKVVHLRYALCIDSRPPDERHWPLCVAMAERIKRFGPLTEPNDKQTRPHVAILKPLDLNTERFCFDCDIWRKRMGGVIYCTPRCKCECLQ